MSHEIICRIVYPTEAAALDMLAQVNARMTLATIAGAGTASVRQSYVRYENEGELVEMRYVDIFGIVRIGEPVATDGPPLWIAPTGQTTSYPVLDLLGNPTRVTWEGSVYENTSGTVNSWAVTGAGAFGWTEVVE